jgi:hypothetical protein
MVAKRYSGIINPERRFTELKPAFNLTLKMMQDCFPMDADYQALLKITQAMNEAALHFMPKRQGSFFGHQPHSSFGDVRKDS